MVWFDLFTVVKCMKNRTKQKTMKEFWLLLFEKCIVKNE